MTKRMAPADRKASILDAAMVVASRLGYSKFRLVDVAKQADCTHSLVLSYYGTMEQVRRDVMRRAIREETLPIIAAGLAAGDRQCRKITPELRERALQTL